MGLTPGTGEIASLGKSERMSAAQAFMQALRLREWPRVLRAELLPQPRNARGGSVLVRRDGHHSLQAVRSAGSWPSRSGAR
jgi:hypothetical protein